MQNLSEIRRANIRALVQERGGLSKLSRLLGYKNPSFLSQMLSADNPTREVTEKTARSIEEAMGLPAGHLDQSSDVAAAPPRAVQVEVKHAPESLAPERPAAAVTVAAGDPTQRMIEAVRLVGAVTKEAGVTIEPDRFAELVALVYADGAERAVRPEIVKMMVKLLR